jgi:hypothetical protein
MAMADAMLPDSSEPFVSLPFNIVLIVSLRLILEHRGGENEAWRWILRLSVVEYLSEAGLSGRSCPPVLEQLQSATA